jgi:hypothetical protein
LPAPASYDYAVVRVVPRVDREEFINAGVILFAKACHFLSACVEVDEERLRALAPEVDMDLVRRHLDTIPRIRAGEEDAGPITWLSRERAVPLDGSAAQHEHPDIAGPRRPLRRSRGPPKGPICTAGGSLGPRYS